MKFRETDEHKETIIHVPKKVDLYRMLLSCKAFEPSQKWISLVFDKYIFSDLFPSATVFFFVALQFMVSDILIHKINN